MHRPTGLSVIATLMFLTAAGVTLFWITFFIDLDAQRSGYLASQSDAWFAWELSFPLADAWIAVTGLLGSVGLWRVRPWGLLCGLLGSGAMVFLGLIDTLFFVQNGLYLPLNGEVALELFIHLWTIAFGLAASATIWKHRDRLLGQPIDQVDP